MKRTLRQLGRVSVPLLSTMTLAAAAAYVAIAVHAGPVWAAGESYAPQAAAATSASGVAGLSADEAQLVKRGSYLASAGDCIACHTASKGTPFAGGLAMNTPVGAVYSTNITPDKETGIGNYTLEDFDNALRHGIAKNGGSLYPAMPYPSYARVSHDDVKALYAYFMHGVAPVHQENRASDIPWPLSMRWPLTIWRWAFAPAVSAVDTSPLSASGTHDDAMLARGKYLVEGLGHCSACHTPRGVGMQEKALTDAGGTVFMSGAEVDSWFAPSLRGDNVNGLGTWNEQEIADFLKTGRTDRTAVFGGMTDVVVDSTQHMTDQDRLAIAHYLKSLAPANAEAAIAASAGEATTTALHNGHMDARGALLYANHCMACHKSNGQGYSQVFPALAGNPVLNTANPDSLIHIILAGSTLPDTQAAATSFHMPAFDYRLTDEQVADVATFVRQGWGNQGTAVTADQVGKLRTALHRAKP